MKKNYKINHFSRCFNITKFNEDLKNIDKQVKNKLKLEVDTLLSNFQYLKNIKLDKINEKLKESTLKAVF